MFGGSGWSKLDSGEVFGIFGGVNLSRGDAAVLYEASKNWFGAMGGRFLKFWPTAFSIFFGSADFFQNFKFLDGFLTKRVAVWANRVWSMKIDIVGFWKSGYDGPFGWKYNFWRNRGPKKMIFRMIFVAFLGVPESKYRQPYSKPFLLLQTDFVQPG